MKVRGTVPVLMLSTLMGVLGATPVLAASGYPVVNHGSGLCIGIAGGSSANGAAVVQFTCNGHLDQQWDLPRPAGSVVGTPGATGLIYNRGAANRCLGTLNGMTGNFTKVVSKACNSSNTDELWTIDSAGYGAYAGGLLLENAKTANERCLGVPGGSTAGSVQLVIFDCNGHPDQVWRPR